MTMYPYRHQIAFDPYTQTVAPGEGKIYAQADVENLEPLTPTDENGIPVTLVANQETGYLPPFYVEDHPAIRFVSAEWVTELVTTLPLVGPPGEPGPPGLKGDSGGSSPEDVALALEAEGPAKDATKSVVAEGLRTPGDPIQTAFTAATARQLETDIPPLLSGLVKSDQVTSIVRTSDPAVVESAPASTLVVFEGRPGVETDFVYGVSDEVIPVWTDKAAWQHDGGSILRRPPTTDSAFMAAVPRVAAGQHGDVDVVAKVRYDGLQTGSKAGVFVRGTGGTGVETFLFASIQSWATDGATNGGLRLNATVNGANSMLGSTTGVHVLNAPWRNQTGVWYYLRLRAVGEAVMAKQWLAADPEPAAWDLALPPASLPTVFKAGGSSRRGSAGLLARHHAVTQDYDYFAAAFNGASAPVKEGA